MKLLHAADLHIDSPLRGLSRYEGAPAEEIRKAAREAVENLVLLAITESVDAVLLAGDIYDGDWKDYKTGLFFAAQMRRLQAADIPVMLVAGNHDAASTITRELRLPDNVHRFATDRPESVILEDLGLAVHGQGYAIRDVTENLAARYPAPRAGLFNVGLLHTALAGYDGHATYAPCGVGELVASGYDYWALGHVHTRQIVHAEQPWIVFPGNTQGRHARETGGKGATLVTVADDGRATLEHRDLDVVRWALVEVDANGARHVEDVLDRLDHAFARERERAEGRLVAVRAHIVGASDAHEALWRDQVRVEAEARALASGSSHIWLEKLRLRTRHVELADSGADLPELVADLARTAAALRADPAELERLIDAVPGLGKVDPGVRDEGIAPDDAAWREEIFTQAVELLTAMIGADDGGQA